MAQTMEGKVLTGRGFVPMGEVDVGDFLPGHSGDSRVIGIEDYTSDDLHVVTVDGEYQSVFTGDHIWDVQTNTDSLHPVPVNLMREGLEDSVSFPIMTVRKDYYAEYPPEESVMEPHLIPDIILHKEAQRGFLSFATGQKDKLYPTFGKFPEFAIIIDDEADDLRYHYSEERMKDSLIYSFMKESNFFEGDPDEFIFHPNLLFLDYPERVTLIEDAFHKYTRFSGKVDDPNHNSYAFRLYRDAFSEKLVSSLHWLFLSLGLTVANKDRHITQVEPCDIKDPVKVRNLILDHSSGTNTYVTEGFAVTGAYRE